MRHNKVLVEEVAEKNKNLAQGTATEMMLQGSHLIYFNDKVKVLFQGKKMEGGYGTIQKYFIENDLAIPKH